MTLETKLQVQAWLDGELPEAEARQVGSWVEQNADAKTLAAHLKSLRVALAGNDPEVKLPESREFYWSKIQREIERFERQELTSPAIGSWWPAWRRWLMPAAGLALVAICAIVAARYTGSGGERTEPLLAVVENRSDHLGSYSFRAPDQKMFVVWVYERADVQDAQSNDELELMFQ